MRLLWILWIALVALGPLNLMRGQSAYHISIDTSAVEGQPGKLALDLTSNRLRTNRTDIFSFTTDGKLTLPETQGGLISGDLVERRNPAPFTRIAGDQFLNELQLNFERFGKQINFSINVSESGPAGNAIPDQFAVYLLDEEGRALVRTRNGADRGNPNFTITIDGERGGELKLYGQRVDRRLRGKIQADDPERNALIDFTITPAWISREEENTLPIVTFVGTLQEFCTRRCNDTPASCTGGEFGLSVSDEKFLRFDDIGNLKARVALIEGDRIEANTHVRVSGSLLSNTLLRVREVELR